MSLQLTPKRTVIKNFSHLNYDMQVLFGLYRDTIDPTLYLEKFVEMYVSKDLVSIDFTLFTSQGNRAGFSVAFFYKTIMHNEPIYIVRSATGLLELYQGRGCHDIVDLYAKPMLFWLYHPFTKMYVVRLLLTRLFLEIFAALSHPFFPNQVATSLKKLRK